MGRYCKCKKITNSCKRREYASSWTLRDSDIHTCKKVMGHKRQNRVALTVSVKETGVRIRWLPPLYHVKSAILESRRLRKELYELFSSDNKKSDSVFKWASFCRCFELYLIGHLTVVENLYSIAQKHCVRLSTLRTSCFWYHSFTATALFLIWLHASCFKNCKLTRMTANKLVYIAVQKCCFFHYELSKHWVFWEYLRKWDVPSSLCLRYVVM